MPIATKPGGIKRSVISERRSTASTWAVLYDSDDWHHRLITEVQSAKAKWGLRRTDFGWQWTR